MSRPKTSNTINGKIDKTFYEEIRGIALKRAEAKLDRNYSPPTVQRKILNHRLWEQLKKDLEIAKFLKDDTGQLIAPFNIFRFIIVTFLAVLFFGGLIYVTGLLNDVFIDIGHQNEGVIPGANFTDAANRTFGKVNESIQALRLVAITLIFSEILLIFVLNSFRRVHPAMFIVWIFIVFLAIMFSAPIANAYESLLNQNVYEGLLLSFTAPNWILLNLPLVVLFVGIIGGIFMFINILRPGGEEPL